MPRAWRSTIRHPVTGWSSRRRSLPTCNRCSTGWPQMTDATPRPDEIAHDAPITDEERERTQRDVVRFLAAFVVFAIAAAIVFLATHHSAGSTDDAAITADPIDAIGPVAGVELASYTQRRQVA